MLPRVYPIVDTAAVSQLGLTPEEFARALADAGAELLQVRHKQAFTREAFDTLQKIVALGVPVIVNDRADLALASHAGGVHLGQQDLPPTRIRAFAPDLTIGFSTHNAAQLEAAAAEPVDYLAIGPVFSTSSKLNPDPEVGLAQLPSLRRLTRKPLVAIGGITRATAPQVWDAGIDSIAVIGDLIPEVPTAQAVRARMEEWLRLSAQA